MRFRPSRPAAALVRLGLRAALRALVTGLIFSITVAVALKFMGVPLPDPRELPGWFEGVSQLSRILS